MGNGIGGIIATVPSGAASPYPFASLPRSERELCAARRSPDRLLSRQAARHALVEMGVCRSDVCQLELRREPNGRPEVWIGGTNADSLTGPTSARRYAVSLSHDGDLGVAAAVPVPIGTKGVSVGVDVVSARRIERWSTAHVEQLRRRVLVADELASGALVGATGCAVAIAAKEAVGKATRHVDNGLRWHDVVLAATAAASVWTWTVATGSLALGGELYVSASATSVIAATVRRPHQAAVGPASWEVHT